MQMNSVYFEVLTKISALNDILQQFLNIRTALHVGVANDTHMYTIAERHKEFVCICVFVFNVA